MKTEHTHLYTKSPWSQSQALNERYISTVISGLQHQEKNHELIRRHSFHTVSLYPLQSTVLMTITQNDNIVTKITICSS